MKYPYKIIYSRRRSILVSVSHGNEITVRCPYGTPEAKIEQFLNSKSGWLDKITEKNNRETVEYADIISLGNVLYNGERKQLILGERARVDGECVRVLSVSGLKRLYLKEFGGTFEREFGEISKKLNLFAAAVGFKDYKSRWGCCFGDGRIYFNYRIFMLPVEIREYIIVHELCHLRHHDHSAAFWNTVENYLPDYRERKKELKKLNFLTRLY